MPLNVLKLCKIKNIRIDYVKLIGKVIETYLVENIFKIFL